MALKVPIQFEPHTDPPPNRVAVTASWLFLVPFFILKVTIGESFIDLRLRWMQFAGLLVLVILCGQHGKASRVVSFAFAAIVLIQVLHATGYQVDSTVASFVEYQAAFFRVWLYLFVVSLSATAVFHREHLARVFTLLAVLSVAVGVAAVLLHAATGVSVLIHSYGDLHRMQAFLSEPSAFAPVVAFLTLYAIKVGGWFISLTAIAGLVFSFSPVVVLTALLAMAMLVFLRPREHIKLLMLGAIAAAMLVPTILLSDPHELLRSESGTQVTLGRLILGIQSVLSGGQEGVNDRFAGLLNVLDFMETESLQSFITGLGFNASAVVFESGLYEVFDHALWITFLFSYGVPGAVGVVLLGLFTSVVLLRRRDLFSRLYLAFFAASLVNSAQGFVSYAFVFVGFAFALKDLLDRPRSLRVAMLHPS